MPRSQRICLVADEVAPFTRGGIGAFVRNTLKAYAHHTEMSLLFTGNSYIDPQIWRQQFPSVKLFRLVSLVDELDVAFLWERKMPRHAFLNRSLDIYNALIALHDQGTIFDLIEFTDWGGSAYHCIAAKRCGIWATQALLSIRLHCTESILRYHEYRRPSSIHRLIFDIERKPLADADIIVTALEPIADFYRSFYSFSDKWRSAVIIETPVVDVPFRSEHTHSPTFSTPITFSSKIQEIKRPRTFVNGVSFFISNCFAFKGSAILLAFTPSEEEMRSLRNQIRQDILSRFVLPDDATKLPRERTLADSIVVFPNAFETFCFAAYEASLLGALVVLNENNPAFGAESPWIDGINCVKFDGTAFGLSQVLEDIFEKSYALRSIEIQTPSEAYWSRLSSLHSKKQIVEVSDDPTCTAYVLHQDQPSSLQHTISVLLQEVMNLQIVIIDNGSISREAIFVLESLEKTYSDRVFVSRNDRQASWPVLLNAAKRRCVTDFACVMPAGTKFTIGAMAAFVEALQRQPDFDILLPSSILLSSYESTIPMYIFHSLGESLSSGSTENTYAAQLFVARASVMLESNFNEEVGVGFVWPYLRSLAVQYRRMLVWPLIDVTYVDTAVAAFDAYLDHDLLINRDVVSKITSEGWGFGLTVDLSPIAAGSSTNYDHHNQILAIADDASTADLDEALIDRGERWQPGPLPKGEMENRRRRREGLVRGALSVISRTEVRLRGHIDLLQPASHGETGPVVARGPRLRMEGWAFAQQPTHIDVADLVLEKEGRYYVADVTSRRSRPDVQMKYDLSNDVQPGFCGEFSTHQLEPGVYRVVVRYSSEKTVFRKWLDIDVTVTE